MTTRPALSTTRSKGRVVAVAFTGAFAFLAASCSDDDCASASSTGGCSDFRGTDAAEITATPPETPAPAPRVVAVTLERTWLTQFGAAGADVALGIGTRPDGGAWVSGHSDEPFGVSPDGMAVGGQDMVVTSVDADGVLGPVTQIGTPATDSLLGGSAAPDGGFYALGYTEADWQQPNAGVNDIVVSRYAADSSLAWSLQLGGPDWDRGFGVSAFDGGVYVGGYTFGGFADALGGSGAAGGHDAVIVRVSDAGVVEWVRQIGSDGVDWGQSVATTPDGAVVITGYTQGDFDGVNAGGRDIWVARLEADGTTAWVTQAGTDAEDWTQGITVSPSGEITVAGLTEGAFADGSTPAGANDVLVVRLSADGEVLWSTQFGTEGEDKAFGVVTTADGWAVVSGYTFGALGETPNAGGKDAYLAVISPDGVLSHIEQFGTEGDDETYAIVLEDPSASAADGAIVLYADGVTAGALDDTPSNGKFDGWVARFALSIS